MFSYKPDYEASKQRIEAFWEREIIDRPVCMITLGKPVEERAPLPVSNHATPEERWLDADYQAALAIAELGNRYYLGDAMPVTYPRMGPEVFSSLYGCPMHYGDYGTSWTDPILHDWADVDNIQLQWDGPVMRKLDELTNALLEAGKGRFVVGMTDWHPGGDGIAAFRDPANLAMDMITHVDEVKALLKRLEADYFAVYDRYYKMLRAAGQPITTWLTLMSDDKFYVPSNDFSCMISPAMFQDVFLPGIINECRFLDRSIYHLDGPQALRHLDALLAIPELDALQWVPGAGREGFVRWVDVYRRAQAAGKGLWINCTLAEVKDVMETLDPHGVCLVVSGVPAKEEADALLADMGRWAARSAR